MRNLSLVPFLLAFANDVDAFIPEKWAMESIALLDAQMVVANLIHRDFEPDIAQHGDVVNTRKPGAFSAKRKTDADNVTVQDATATNIQVTLNQHIHVSFRIKDGEESKSMTSLVDFYLRPALQAQAQFLDQILLAEAAQFTSNIVGNGLVDMTADNIVDLRKKMNDNKAPQGGRNLILSTSAEAAILKIDKFTSADKIGDDGTALREASIGRRYGFDIYMCQNIPQAVNSLTDQVTGAINMAAGGAVGVTSITVDGFSAAIQTGAWFLIVGEGQPHQVTGTTGGATPTAIAFTPALTAAVADNAVVATLPPGKVNFAAGYAAGYAKEIVYDTFTKDPQVGQMLTFTTSTVKYVVIQVDTTAKTILLDRPLVAALTDNDNIALLPGGSHNFAFTRNAFALVSRPLALPRQGMGALSAVVNYNGLSVRVVMTYDGVGQGTLVTIDMLCGLAKLDSPLGAVLVSA